jgi:predicted metal-binding membrane protein
MAGCVQVSPWKARQLQRCWAVLACVPSVPEGARTAWQRGVRLGVRCNLCCSGYMILLLVTGMMNLGVIALVAGAITVERLAPRPERSARACGVVIILTGAVLIARALGVA